MRLKATASALFLAVAVLAVGISGCGGGDGSTSTGGTASGESTNDSAGLQAAAAAIKPYVGQARPAFPVSEPLSEPPKAGSELSQLQFGTPTAALIAEITEGAVAAAGLPIGTVKAGNTATSVQAAADTIISQSPDAVLLPAAEPTTFSQQLGEMDEKGIKSYSAGIMNPQDFGITAGIFDQRQSKLVGKLLADWVTVKGEGSTKVVFYETPELSFNAIERDAFLGEMKAVCSGCEARTVAISAEELGSTAPQTVVSDLQRHSDTEAAVFATQEAASGLPSALKIAGIDVEVVGFAAGPTELEYIKNGEMDATLGLDLPVMVWTQVDMALRGIAGQQLTPGEKAGIMPMQFLTQEDITFDPSKGWTATPNFAEKFASLWKVSP